MGSGRNTCKCPNPPGGEVDCGEDQMAVCRVINGQAHGECIDPPEDTAMAGGDQLKNWVLQEVFGQTRSPYASISSQEEDILRQGYYKAADGTETTFRMPTSKGKPAPAMTGSGRR
jgi:hypothetical protein